MSSRALRKAQREREEQERLKRLEQEARDLEEEDADEVEESHIQPAKKSAFAMLEEEEDADEDDDETQRHSQDEDDTKAPTIESIPKPSTKKKRKKKKGKAANGTHTPADDDKQLDEIDKALKQLSTSSSTSTPGITTAGINSAVEETSELLAIDTHHLHAQNEMRRLFGRAALEQEHEDEAPQQGQVGGTRRQQRRAQHVGLAQAVRGHGHGAQGARGGLSAVALKRNIFIQGKEDWPLAPSGGLGMEIEEKRADGTISYKFVHNRIYRDVQAQFAIAVESMDPNQLVALLQHNPYHISTLLQVSEIAKSERDHTTAGDLLERALFSFGRAVHSTLTKMLVEGKARLDFRREENREFWLAAWRYMQNLSMRGTWRTVYEWAKLLLSLAPEEDWYGVWLVLDQYALRARQDLDFLNLSRNPTLKSVHGTLPNVHLGQGLAEYRAGNKGKGKQALFTSIGRYPWVVAALMRELNISPPPAVWGKEPRTEKEKLFAELYATRAKDIWNTPENSALLLEIASAIPPETPAAHVDDGDIDRNVARHVLLSDTPTLIALIPRRFTNEPGSASDPLPPTDSYPSYLPTDLLRSGGARGVAGREEPISHGFFRWLNSTAGIDALDARNRQVLDQLAEESGLEADMLVQQMRREMREDMDQFEEESLRRGSQEELPLSESDDEGDVVVGGRQPRVEDAEDAGD